VRKKPRNASDSGDVSVFDIRLVQELKHELVAADEVRRTLIALCSIHSRLFKLPFFLVSVVLISSSLQEHKWVRIVSENWQRFKETASTEYCPVISFIGSTGI